jgi:hypothetical protein
LEKSVKKRESRYPKDARSKTRLKPVQKAINKAEIELTTEEKALVAHAQGISPFSFSAKSRIPVGKGNPIRKPRGKTTKKVRSIFRKRLRCMRTSNNKGMRKRYRTMSPAQMRRLILRFFLLSRPRIFFEKKLPRLEEKSREKIMIEIEYMGCPRKRINL